MEKLEKMLAIAGFSLLGLTGIAKAEERLVTVFVTDAQTRETQPRQYVVDERGNFVRDVTRPGIDYVSSDSLKRDSRSHYQKALSHFKKKNLYMARIEIEDELRRHKKGKVPRQVADLALSVYLAVAQENLRVNQNKYANCDDVKGLNELHTKYGVGNKKSYKFILDYPCDLFGEDINQYKRLLAKK